MKVGKRILPVNDTYLVGVFFLDFLQRRKQSSAVRTLEVGKFDDSHGSARRSKRRKARGREVGAKRFEVRRYPVVLLQPGNQCLKRDVPSLVQQIWSDLRKGLFTAYRNARLVFFVKFFDFLVRWRLDVSIHFL